MLLRFHTTEVCSYLWFLWCNIWKLSLAVQITRISWRYSKNNFLFKLDSRYWLTKRRWVLCLWSTCYWSISLLAKHKRNQRLNRPNYLHLTFHFYYGPYDLLSLSHSLSLFLSTFSFYNIIHQIKTYTYVYLSIFGKYVDVLTLYFTCLLNRKCHVKRLPVWGLPNQHSYYNLCLRALIEN